jgi:general secretion pathway protein G
MHKKTHRFSGGFTLIELLVVIAIISLLSTVVMTSVTSARAKARDTRKQADFRSIATALQLFFDTNNRMPNNYHPGFGATEGDGYYEQSMQELINAGFLSKVPKSPGGGLYRYYNYGRSNAIGALVVTTLETAPNTTTGVLPSCRPWAPSANWCDQSSNKYYCICNPF